MRRPAAFVLAAALLPGGTWVPAEATAARNPADERSSASDEEFADTHPETGVTSRRESGARVLEAVVPGVLLDWAALRSAEGPPRLFLLVAPEEPSATGEGTTTERRALYRVWLENEEIREVPGELPRELDSLEGLDLDGDGEDELLLGAPGRISTAALRADGAPIRLEPFFAATGLDLAAALSIERGAGELSLPTVGALRRVAAGRGPIAVHPLPRRASRHLHGLRLTSPPSALLRLPDELVYALGPEAFGDRRLRSVLLPVNETTGDETAERAAWSRLPAAERVQWSWFRVLDGRPVLLVTTNSADHLGILERQKLRLFSLYGDRTQSGVGPWLTAQTASRRWQRVEPWIADVDADGDDDVVIAQYDGLGSGKVKLEAFLNSGSRSFLPRTRSTVIDRPAGAWHFGDDLSGDGLPDLVLLSEGALEIYPMLTSDRRLVAARPDRTFAGGDIPRVEHSVELGGGGIAIADDRPRKLGVPRTLDLDGDGVLDLLLAENPQWGFGRLRVVLLPPARSR